ncbi:hypothetical protein BBP40_010831 [Aspergillus hancockii]|nr:hypothetical protein BBP40_010831 [Aspergillus hancockii]
MLDFTYQVPLDVARKAVENALSDNDIQSVFFVTHINQGAAKDTQDSISNADASKYYWAVQCEAKIQEMIQDGKLPGDFSLDSGVLRSSYRVKIFDSRMLLSPWLIFRSESHVGPETLFLRKEYHHDKNLYQEIFETALQHPDFSQIQVLRAKLIAKYVAEMVSLNAIEASAHRRFWFLMTTQGDAGTKSCMISKYTFAGSKNVADYRL